MAKPKLTADQIAEKVELVFRLCDREYSTPMESVSQGCLVCFAGWCAPELLDGRYKERPRLHRLVREWFQANGLFQDAKIRAAGWTVRTYDPARYFRPEGIASSYAGCSEKCTVRN